MLQKIDLYDYCVERVYEYVYGPKKKRPNKVNFRCPFCGDSKTSKRKMRGWLYKGKSGYPSFHCFNCDSSFNTFKFLARLQNKSESDVKKDLMHEYKKYGGASVISILSPDSPQSVSGEVLSRGTFIQEAPSNEDVEIDSNWRDISTSQAAQAYINKRKIMKAPFIAKNWKLYFDIKTERIIIPWQRNGAIKYYQARTLKKDETKYLFPKDSTKDIFGLDSLDTNFPYIFLLEGAFDSIFVKNGIALGGLSMTEHQEEVLEKYEPFNDFVWFTDNPWKDEASKTNILKLTKENPQSLFFLWDKTSEKDVNDDVLKSKNLLKYADTGYLESRIITGMQYHLKLSFNR